MNFERLSKSSLEISALLRKKTVGGKENDKNN